MRLDESVRRFVLDTSTLVSAALRTGSVLDQTLLKARRTCDVCASAETLEELAQVLSRKKFDRYLDRESYRAFIARTRRQMHLFAVRKNDRTTGFRCGSEAAQLHRVA